MESANEPVRCFFCRAIEEGATRHRENLVLHDSAAGLVVLNRYPYNSGHVLVAPREHVAAPDQLVPIAAADLDALLRRVLGAVRAAYTPDGMNVGMNLGQSAGAGVPDHCHWHIVPRWSGDTNFMPVLGQTKVMSESLEETLRKLQATF